MTNAETPQQAASLAIEQAFQQAVTHHQAGHLQDAEQLYSAILHTQPDHPDAQHNLDVLTEQVELAAASLLHFKTTLEANPDQSQHWLNYIDALIQTDQAEIAQQMLQLGQQNGLQGEMVNVLAERLEYIVQRATQSSEESRTEESPPVIKTNSKNNKLKASNKHTKSKKKSSSLKGKAPPPQQIDVLVNLFNTGQHTETMKLAQQMTENFPHYDFGWKALGTVLKQLGQAAKALYPLEKAVKLSPNDAETLNNLSITYKVLGQIDKAEASCRQALQIKPDLAEAHNTLGIILHKLDRFSEAETSHRCALQIKPNYVGAYNNLGTTLKDMGRFDEAKASCFQALEINPGNAPTYLTLGVIYHEIGQFKEAEASYRQALEIDPNYATAHYNLGNTFKEQDLSDKAEACFRQALMINPDYALAHSNLGNILKEQGLIDEAEVCYRRSLQLQPDYKTAFNNLLFTLNYHPDKSASEIFEAYQEYDAKYCLPLQSTWRPHNNNRVIERRLRVGYMSPDFRNHSVQFFLEPLLAHHDKQAVEVYAYAELTVEDAVTTRYKNYVDEWIPTCGLSDAALAERIRADGIDILVDLAGHTAKNRLPVFAHKPAPVSISWLGYGYTTGLSAIDYFLTDITTVPHGSEDFFSESPCRVATPSFSYRPAKQMGEVNALPALTNGYITFGTLTRAVRINHRTIKSWSEILKRVQGSRLVIDSKSFCEKYMQDLLIKKFAAHGIERERLAIGFHSPPWDVLRGIDIGLDCFPHNSGTTLFETLYMGVPYITLAERPSVGRLGSCILQGLGRPQWIAESEEVYVDKAVELANDTNRLSEIRAGLRDQMENSPLRDEKNFALKVETAYRNIWKNWCEKKDNT